MAVYILFFVKIRTHGKFFQRFPEVFQCFRPRGNFFAGAENFEILAGAGAIQMVQKIVEIGAILAIFRPFEICTKIVLGRPCLNLLQGYKK